MVGQRYSKTAKLLDINHKVVLPPALYGSQQFDHQNRGNYTVKTLASVHFLTDKGPYIYIPSWLKTSLLHYLFDKFAFRRGEGLISERKTKEKYF